MMREPVDPNHFDNLDEGPHHLDNHDGAYLHESLRPCILAGAVVLSFRNNMPVILDAPLYVLTSLGNTFQIYENTAQMDGKDSSGPSS